MVIKSVVLVIGNNMTELQYLGNKDLLKLYKTAFLASSTISLDTVLRCYDWATSRNVDKECVISGFNSLLEKDVLHFLLKSKTPVILVLARRMYKVIPEELKTPLDEGHLLIISTSNGVRQSKATALARNRYICEQADSILFVGITQDSSLFQLFQAYERKRIEF